MQVDELIGDERDGYILNPFLAGMNIKTNKVLKKVAPTKMIIYDTEKGRIEKTDVVYASEKNVDKAGYVKFFLGFFPVIGRLSKGGLRLLIHMLHNELKYENDKVILDLESSCQLAGFNTHNQYYTAVNELIDNKIIARSPTRYVYWINPSFFYFGDRRYLLMDKQTVNFTELKNLLDGNSIPS